MKILVTGGTVFVSKFTAQYFAEKGHQVFVLNRNTRPQAPGVTLIQADRHGLQGVLKPYRFDAVLDMTAYTEEDVRCLLEGLGGFGQYVFLSSSAVYPETLPQPFREDMPLGGNKYWGAYGTDKIQAEMYLLGKVPGAYILRPPYLYGPMNNLYREAFVFDCAEQGRPFYLPKDGAMALQFFHIRDLCLLIERLLEKRPGKRIYNVGNPETVTVRQWVQACYQVLGLSPRFIPVGDTVPQRSYFPFLDYPYSLDVAAQTALLPTVTSLGEGLGESYAWYKDNREQVRRKPLLSYIDENLR